MLTHVVRTYLAKKRLLLHLLAEAKLMVFPSNRLDLGMPVFDLGSLHDLLAGLPKDLWSLLIRSQQHLSNSALHLQPGM